MSHWFPSWSRGGRKRKYVDGNLILFHRIEFLLFFLLIRLLMCANIFFYFSFTAAANETSHIEAFLPLVTTGKPHNTLACTDRAVYVDHQNNEISNYSRRKNNMKRNSLLRWLCKYCEWKGRKKESCNFIYCLCRKNFNIFFVWCWSTFLLHASRNRFLGQRENVFLRFYCETSRRTNQREEQIKGGIHFGFFKIDAKMGKRF